jgi:hypothetical protein
MQRSAISRRYGPISVIDIELITRDFASIRAASIPLPDSESSAEALGGCCRVSAVSSSEGFFMTCFRRSLLQFRLGALRRPGDRFDYCQEIFAEGWKCPIRSGDVFDICPVWLLEGGLKPAPL